MTLRSRSAAVGTKQTSAGTDDCNSFVKMICYKIIKKKGARPRTGVKMENR
jgi:hypothetical protein